MDLSREEPIEITTMNGSIWIFYHEPIYFPKDPPLDKALWIMNGIFFIICLLGLVGNGMVIWLLGFRIKRNPFTTYILNLAIADFGVLLFVGSFAVWYAVDLSRRFWGGYVLLTEVFFFLHCSSAFLLVAISIDRCMAVLFPLWYRCHKPPRLSAFVCALIWILSFLIFVLRLIVLMAVNDGMFSLKILGTVAAFLCTPLMVISTLTLFIKVCCKPQQHRRGKLVTVILFTLLFFLIFAFPVNAIYIITFFNYGNFLLTALGFICALLNSSINPLIYFLVGRRQKQGRPRVSMEFALQRVFKDEEGCVEEQNATAEAQLGAP
ncbi:proto-oncogene Mas-like [Hemicordylus capensis]|uniref:proto-oncogene Mas-like n=1 Tax=Hemicordylus capensis TaxID=884348 RepID=UPI00230280EF|nr:proto-oncogene Mas-like [Hemicordylus capensis]